MPRSLRIPLLIPRVMWWLLLFSGGTLYAQADAFITTWNTANISGGSSNETSITIPTSGAGYNYQVDWNNDGVYEQTGVAGSVTHIYGTAGTYTVRIRGAFPRIYFNGAGDCQKLLNISQWGTIAWTSMASAFQGCINLDITATDLPNLTGVSNMSNMFYECSSLTGPANINNWNTANVTNMSFLFAAAGAFNQPLANWNTANVTNMAGVFSAASSFNQPVNSWNTAKVTDMSYMFAYGSFNQPLANWNTAKVIDMNQMFAGAIDFNQDIGNWNTGKVQIMTSMFTSAFAFNQSIENWNTSSVWDMSGMFQSAFSFNQPIGNLDVSSVPYMNGMFYNALAFNQSLGNWTLKDGVNLDFLLNESGMNCQNYSSTLIGWRNNLNTPDGLTLYTDRGYGTNAASARDYLISDKNWTIDDYFTNTNCAAVLPVELVSFTGKQQDGNVLLTWRTATEMNNRGWDIERSADGRQWQTIGFRAGQGTTSEEHAYTFTDTKPFSGQNYYRLKQQDHDGQYEYSDVVQITMPGNDNETGTFYPNPARAGMVSLDYYAEKEGDLTISVFDAVGRLVLRHTQAVEAERNLLQFDFSGLTAGVYNVVLDGDGSRVNRVLTIE